MFLASAAAGLGKDPMAIDVAGGQVELVLGRQRGQQGGDQLGLPLAAGGVHRGRRVGQDQQLQRLAVGQQLPLQLAFALGPLTPCPSPGGEESWRRELHHEVAVVAAAVRDQHHVRLPALHLDHRLEILRRRVFLGAELDVGRMRGQGVAGRVRRRTDRLQRLRRIDLHVDLKLPQADAA